MARLAQSVGAFVFSVPTSDVLSVAPRLSVLPWDFGQEAPAWVLPEVILINDQLQWQARSNYNAITVLGDTQGVIVNASLAGTAGDVMMAPVVGGLILSQAMGRARAAAELGEAQSVAATVFTLPVFAPGGAVELLKPGEFIQVNEAGTLINCIVDGVQITAGRTEQGLRIDQTITVSRF